MQNIYHHFFYLFKSLLVHYFLVTAWVVSIHTVCGCKVCITKLCLSIRASHSCLSGPMCPYVWEHYWHLLMTEWLAAAARAWPESGRHRCLSVCGLCLYAAARTRTDSRSCPGGISASELKKVQKWEVTLLVSLTPFFVSSCDADLGVCMCMWTILGIWVLIRVITGLLPISIPILILFPWNVWLQKNLGNSQLFVN